jgi:hypothetical protein
MLVSNICPFRGGLWVICCWNTWELRTCSFVSQELDSLNSWMGICNQPFSYKETLRNVGGLWALKYPFFRFRSSFSYLRLFLEDAALEESYCWCPPPSLCAYMPWRHYLRISSVAKCSIGRNQVGILSKFRGGRALVAGWLRPCFGMNQGLSLWGWGPSPCNLWGVWGAHLYQPS